MNWPGKVVATEGAVTWVCIKVDCSCGTETGVVGPATCGKAVGAAGCGTIAAVAGTTICG